MVQQTPGVALKGTIGATLLALYLMGVTSATLLAPQPASAQPNDPETWDTETLYMRACAACHGADGKGIPPDHPNYANFKRPPADFTDPLFNSREPAADWFLVIKYGGARLGLSQQMPTYEQALSDEQIEDLVTYLKEMVDTSRYPPGDLNFLRPQVTIKAFPEDEALIINRYSRRKNDDPDRLLTTLYYARRFGARFQGEIKLEHLNQLGGSDELDALELGFKWALHDNLRTQTLYALGIEAVIPLEDSEAPDIVIPYFSLAKGASDTITFQATLKSRLPTDDPGNGEVQLTGIVHWMPSIWPRSASPGLEFRLTEPFPSDRSTRASLIPQLYIGLSKGGHVAFSVGAEVPITDLPYNYRILTFLLWDIADGPFWIGW